MQLQLEYEVGESSGIQHVQDDTESDEDEQLAVGSWVAAKYLGHKYPGEVLKEQREGGGLHYQVPIILLHIPQGYLRVSRRIF